jgi:uncharacterized protein (DUF1800 family)
MIVQKLHLRIQAINAGPFPKVGKGLRDSKYPSLLLDCFVAWCEFISLGDCMLRNSYFKLRNSHSGFKWVCAVVSSASGCVLLCILASLITARADAENNPIPQIKSANPAQLLPGTTTTVTLAGTGFVPGTVLTSSVGTVTASYVSATSLTARITIADSATGNLTLQAQNPAPGGGKGASFQEPIWTIQLTATDSDGVNTGTARLGVPVALSTVAHAGLHYNVSWSETGVGKLVVSQASNTDATYTPPTGMPDWPKVYITAYMEGDPSVTTTYALTLVYPVPKVTAATPAQLSTGGTQTVTLAGSGFVPGTTVAFNGKTLPIKYISSNAATVQVPVAATAADTLNFQVSNPAPGGGAGTKFTETVTPNSIALTATDGNEINTGKAKLGVALKMSAAVTGSMQTGVNWSMTGAGSISGSGVYTPPAIMPANRKVSIQAALASNPAITASYPLNIINPVPEIIGASVGIVPAGATTTVTLTGTGFVPTTVVQINGVAVPTTYGSAASLVAQIAVAAGATGSLQAQAYTATYTGGLGDIFDLAISAPVDTTVAARILDQTTFGPTPSLIAHVQREGVTAWLTEQFNTPPTVLPVISNPIPSYCGDPEDCMEGEWWDAVITGNDQLRQRVAFALSQMLVVSSDSMIGYATQYYANLLAQDAFTNWYTIMNDVTLSPAMGIYLDMHNMYKPTATEISNENYARENMQLFNLGLDLLSQNGTLQLDGNGNPIPSYTEAQVQAFARAYTGWTYANADGSTPGAITDVPNYYHQLVAIENEHDENSKAILNGTTLPAGQTAEQDMAGALTNIFQHPNVPPFVSLRLIQHLVKSDPSPAYVQRVADVFTNDGNGVRGNMTAVITAILTDPEARQGDASPQVSDGHMREPILWLSAAMRGLGYVNVDPNNYYRTLSHYTLNEIPYSAPSVFNFFPAEYVIPGTTLIGPEFGIENTASVVDRLSLADELVNNQIQGFNVDLSATSPLGLLASNPPALVDQLGMIFMHGQMDPNIRAAIISEISGLTSPQMVRIAAYLVITASQYKIDT